MDRNIDQLRSINETERIKNMTEKQKLEFIAQIKKQSTYMLFNANRALECKDLATAKKNLLYIIDSCQLIESYDRQIEKILTICCQYLGRIMKKQNQKRKTTFFGLNQFNGSYLKRNVDYIVLKYNKFSGQFQFDQNEKKINNKDVLFYVSKLNSILIGSQNIQSHNSIVAALKTYSLAFFIFALLVGVLAIYLFTKIIADLVNIDENSPLYFAPIIIIGFSFVFPMLMIYFKKLFQKDTQFFQAKLGVQIKRINQKCIDQGKKITFQSPMCAQLNIKIQEQQLINPKSQNKISDVKSINL